MDKPIPGTLKNVVLSDIVANGAEEPCTLAGIPNHPIEGVIVNFSSGWGRSTDAEVAPYCASKWAIEGLTLSLAQELPKGLAAVSINPGVINTDMLQSCFGGSADGYIGPNEWAKKAVPFFLKLGASDNGKQLTV